MEHLAFYNVGCDPATGGSRVKVWVRRQARRVLLPMSRRAVEILASLAGRLDAAEHHVGDLRGQVDDLRRRHDDQAAKLPATVAFGWDYVAMVRRLAVLEEHVDALLTARDAEAALRPPAPGQAVLAGAGPSDSPPWSADSARTADG